MWLTVLGEGERIWRSVVRHIFFQISSFSDLRLLSSDLCNPSISKNDPHAQDIFCTITIPGKQKGPIKDRKEDPKLISTHLL